MITMRADLPDEEIKRLYNPRYVVLYAQQVRIADEILRLRKRFRADNLPHCPQLPESK